MERNESLFTGHEGHILSISIGRPNLMDTLRVTCSAEEDEREQYIAMTGEDWDVDEIVTTIHRKTGPKFVFLFDDEEPVAIGGFDLLAPGVWQTWFIAKEGAWKHGKGITEHCRELIDVMFNEGARRIQILALTSRQQACKWYEKGLRMKQESVARNYGTSSEDVACYVRFRE